MQVRNALLWLLLFVHAGCVPLPRLTLAASSSFRSREAPYRRSVLLSTTATLGWAVSADSSASAEPNQDTDQAPSWSDQAATCGRAALCGWERQARDQALARVGLPLEGPIR